MLSKKELRDKVNSRFGVKTKKEAIEFLKTKMVTDNKWLLRGVMAIYKKEVNGYGGDGMGFSQHDYDYMMGMAKLIMRGAWLSSDQLSGIRHTMKKYCGQLYVISLTTLKFK